MGSIAYLEPYELQALNDLKQSLNHEMMLSVTKLHQLGRLR